MILTSHANLPLPLASGLIDWLLGLSKVSWSDPRSTLAWRWALPAWAWVVVAAGAVGLAGWSYRNLLGPRWARVALAAVRATILFLVVVLLVGPMLVLNQEKVESDWLLMLVDRSASMTICDMHSLPPSHAPGSATAPVEAAPTSMLTRDAALRAALTRQADVFGPDKLGHDRHLAWLGFDSTTYEIDPPTSGGPVTAPQGQSTLIRTAIEQALQRGAGRPISGIVLMSDGRSPQSTSGELVRRLQQQGVSVFTVPLGGDSLPLELSIAQVDSPDRAFVNDAVPVSVWIDRYPAEAKVDPARLHVRLVDVATGQVLDQRTPTDPTLHEPVILSTQSATIGMAHWRIELIYDPAPGSPGSPATTGAPGATDNIENTRREVTVEMVDKPIRVLYVDGYPRWEYRFLKNMLVREGSIESSIMLISADRGFAQEGQIPIQRLPRNALEFKPYDVIIIGDVPSEYFTPEQRGFIVDQVASHGAGLLWIGGGNDTPVSYAGTPLAALLPMRNPGAVLPLDSAARVQAVPTPLANALQVLKLREPTFMGLYDKGDSPFTGGGDPSWPASLPLLCWVQDLGRLKPSAEVLANGLRLDAPGSPPFPLVTRMRYGAGQVVYVASDDTWRWRKGRGELYFEQFWVQLVRMLGRNRVQQTDDRVTLQVSNRRVQAEQPVVVDLTLHDDLLIRHDLPKISVGVFKADSPQSGEIERIDLLPKHKSTSGSDQTSDLESSSGSSADTVSSSGGYEAIWRPMTTGHLVLRIAEPELADLAVTQPIEVLRPDDEMRDPTPDRERMVTLAKETGGAVVELGHFDELTKLVPNRARRTPDDIREPLWNSYLALIVLVVLLTAEWIGRKAIRLV